MKAGILYGIIVRLLVLFLFFNVASPVFSQEAKVNKHKIEREQKKKAKKAQKDYEKAVKQHRKNQSKETRSMMNKADRDAKKKSPVKPAKGKKCK